MKTTQTPLNRAGAFTLIELLTVIAIVGVLAAILVPAIGGVREKAMRAESVSNLRSLHTAIKLYAQDKGELPNPWVAANKNTNRQGGNWRRELASNGYLSMGDEGIRNDRNNPENYSVLGSPVQRAKASHITTDRNPPLSNTYGMNGNLGSSGGNNPNVPKIRELNFISPARTLLISEGSTFGKDQSFNVAIWDDTMPEYTGDTVALLYIDGHVEEMPIDDFPKGKVGRDDRDHPHWFFWRGQE